MSHWIRGNLGPDVPVHFTAFHPAWKLRDKPPTPFATLQRSREIALNSGLRYVYTGNVHDGAGSSTYCHQCGGTLIGRDWYRLTAWHLTDDGCCRACGAACAGRFEGPAGDWGARRRPVRLSDFAAAGP